MPSRGPIYLRPGLALGPYHLIERLGGGDAADVWSARDAIDGRWALKVLLSHEPSEEAMFRDEAELSRKLVHPGIVGARLLLELDGTLVQVMELVNGLDLDAVMRWSQGPIEPWPVSLHVLTAVAEAMTFAHELTTPAGIPLGLVHRDLTPSNVLLGWDGKVRVLDFGIAWTRERRPDTRTQMGFVKGKLDYVAPESKLRRGLDHRADIYSLGVLAERLIRPAETREGLPTSVAADLGELFERMQHPKPDERPGSMREVSAHLSGWMKEAGYDPARSERELKRTLSAVARGKSGAPASEGIPARGTALKPLALIPDAATDIDLDAHEGISPIYRLGADADAKTLPIGAVSAEELRAASPTANARPEAGSLLTFSGERGEQQLRLLKPIPSASDWRAFSAELVPEGTLVRAHLVPIDDGGVRLGEETESLSLLDSPHTVRVQGWGRHGPALGVWVCDLPEGAPLKTLLDSNSAASRRTQAQIARSVAAALAEAHAYGAIHGALSPSCIYHVPGSESGQLDFVSADRWKVRGPSPADDVKSLGRCFRTALREMAPDLSRDLLFAPPDSLPTATELVIRLEQLLADATPLLVEAAPSPKRAPGPEREPKPEPSRAASSNSRLVGFIDDGEDGEDQRGLMTQLEGASRSIDTAPTTIAPLPRREPSRSSPSRAVVVASLGLVGAGLALAWLLAVMP